MESRAAVGMGIPMGIPMGMGMEMGIGTEIPSPRQPWWKGDCLHQISTECMTVGQFVCPWQYVTAPQAMFHAGLFSTGFVSFFTQNVET